jgi:hypothetical protein
MAKVGVLAFTEPDDFEERIDAYFQSRMASRMVFVGIVDGERCYEREEYMKPPTIAGLALALGCDRRTLIRYGKGEGQRDPRLSLALARAKLRAAEWWEEALAVREVSNGAKFALEVNYGYGLDDERDGDGGSFSMNVIPPAVDSSDKLAAPKWEPED